MRSRAAVATLVACVAGVAIVLLCAATDRRHLAFSLAVRPSEPGVEAQPGQEACQRDVDAEEPFDSVTILPAAFFHPVPRLRVRVLDRRTRAQVASATLGDGHPENKATTIRLDRTVPKGRPIDVCFRNLGAWKLAFFSGPASDNEPSFGTLDGKFIQSDVLIEFVRSKPRTTWSRTSSGARPCSTRAGSVRGRSGCSPRCWSCWSRPRWWAPCGRRTGASLGTGLAPEQLAAGSVSNKGSSAARFGETAIDRLYDGQRRSR
jgi:hypothetical protein